MQMGILPMPGFDFDENNKFNYIEQIVRNNNPSNTKRYISFCGNVKGFETDRLNLMLKSDDVETRLLAFEIIKVNENMEQIDKT